MADNFDLVNTGMGGRLVERLQALRDAGTSMVAIAQLFTDEGYPVSRESIRRWIIAAGLPTKIAPGLSSGSAAAPGPGEFSTTGTDSGGSSRGVHPSPSAGARIASPGGGATSVAGRASGAVPAAAALGPQGAPAGDSSSTERRSA